MEPAVKRMSLRMLNSGDRPSEAARSTDVETVDREEE